MSEATKTEKIAPPPMKATADRYAVVLASPDTMNVICKPIPQEEFNEKMQEVVRDMFTTMYHHDGIGLAAPQIGIYVTMAVLHFVGDDAEEPGTAEVKMVLVNPVITGHSEEKDYGYERCLSIPGEHCHSHRVPRYKEIDVEYYTPDFRLMRLHAVGFLARVIQHEVDHLSGKYYVDHLPRIERRLILDKCKKFQYSMRPVSFEVLRKVQERDRVKGFRPGKKSKRSASADSAAAAQAPGQDT